MERIILASASPRRKELLARIGMEFEIFPAKGEEYITKEEPPEVVMELACNKAREVAQEIMRQSESESSETLLVIGADTVVAYDGEILGKPKDAQDAIRMLTMLAGNTHSVYTGVTLLLAENGSWKERTFYEETKVTMYPMSREEIEAYVAGEPVDSGKVRLDWAGKAGGYGIQDPFGMKYIKGIEGDYYNVVGLPVARMNQERMKIQSVSVFDRWITAGSSM